MKMLICIIRVLCWLCVLVVCVYLSIAIIKSDYRRRHPYLCDSCKHLEQKVDRSGDYYWKCPHLDTGWRCPVKCTYYDKKEDDQ